MTLKKFLMAGIVVAVLVACGDDDSSDFATRPSGDSSSACEDCDGSSSSKAKSSSSSAKSSSSSKAKSSSSSSVPEGYVDPSTVVKGSMTDERDGQTYKTVTIGTQTWMAENLNYAYTGVPYHYMLYTSDSTSWCYKDSAEYCVKYGRLYTWAAAMDSVGTWSTNGKGCGYVNDDDKMCSPTYPVRGVCPEGWHLPDTTEWNMLFTAVGGKSIAGKMLKSTSGWYNRGNGNGTDAFAFSALPAGSRDYNGIFNDERHGAYFWISSEAFNSGAYCRRFYSDGDRDINGDYVYLGTYGKEFGYSVRCVKD